MTVGSDSDTAKTVKQCCARLYESNIAKILLGDSFHPGGMRLTERLGTLLSLKRHACVLDVASGTGTSGLFLAGRFGCEVVGVDYSGQNMERANELAANRGLASRVHFEMGDAERLQFPDASFDAVVCECAFCTFPDKATAAREFARILRPGGRVGISDLTRGSVLPKELEGLLAWIACIADAQPLESYADYLRSADLDVEAVENHDRALIDMVHQIRLKLLSAEVLVGLKKLTLPDVDFASAKQMARVARDAIQQNQLGYAILVARRKF
ncbi:MAG: class I SAM-dependent methyltransferase [Candidatus Acidiferrales bacterium]